MITKESTDIVVKGYIGKWYVIDSCITQEGELFLLEHQTYGDETQSLIVDSEGKLVLDEVWNGWHDYFISDLTR